MIVGHTPTLTETQINGCIRLILLKFQLSMTGDLMLVFCSMACPVIPGYPTRSCCLGDSRSKFVSCLAQGSFNPEAKIIIYYHDSISKQTYIHNPNHTYIFTSVLF